MHLFPKALLWTSLSAFCLIRPVVARETPHLAQTGGTTSSPLEIHVSSIQWGKDCLLVGIDLINQSTVPVFLTVMGPYFDVALDVSQDQSSGHKDLEWVNAWGVSDIVSWDTKPLAPNARTHENYCIGEKVWIVNRKKETHREIPVRGKMRISVSYFPNEDARKKNKMWHDDPSSLRNPWNPPEDIGPNWSTTTLDIPCPSATCVQDCSRPPRGFDGEGRAVPDIYGYYPDWNQRGDTLTRKLNRKYPPCAEVK